MDFRDVRTATGRYIQDVMRLLIMVGVLGASISFAQQTVLTIATHYTDDQRAPLTACFREYERLHPGTTIVHRQLSYRDVLQTLFMSRMSGAPPDIYNLSTVWMEQLVDSGALAAPTREVTDFVARSYLENTVASMTGRGQIWGIPSEVDVYMLVYNKLLLARAGLSQPPATLDDLVRDAARISKSNRQGQLTTAGFGFGNTQSQISGPFLTLLYSNGGSVFSSDRKSTNLNSEAARKALDGEIELFKTHGTSWGSRPDQFPSGSLGMMIVPNWFQRQLHQAFEQRFDETVGVAPIPGGANWRTSQYAFFWSVDASSSHAGEAWALLQWLNSARHRGSRSCVGDMLLGFGALTGNRDDLAASAADLDNPFMQPFVDALSSGRALPQPSVPHANEIEALLSNYLERALLGVLPADRALSELDAAIRLILEEKD